MKRKLRLTANYVDAHIGKRLKIARSIAGLSQEQLGEKIGLTFQQIQKYERGSNKISASKLFELAKVMNTDINFFYRDVSQSIVVSSSGKSEGGVGGEYKVAENQSDFDHQVQEIDYNDREALNLLRTYFRITNDGARKKVMFLIEEISKVLC